jgi:hypothetical protein
MKRFIFGFGLWTGVLMLVAKGALKFGGISGDTVDLIKDYAMDGVIVNTFVMTALQGYTGIDIKLPDGLKLSVIAAFMLLAPLFLIGSAHAQASSSAPTLAPIPAVSQVSLPYKAKPVNPFSQPYDPGRCGGYFGVNTIGLAGSVNGANVQPGTQVVQAGAGGVVGYGCPINADTGSFYFGEVMADITNFNGSTPGLNFSGPVSFTERFGVGSPLTNMISSLWNVNGNQAPAVPNLPTLPNGVTAGPGSPYAFVALHEYDVSLYDGLQKNQQWLITTGIGLGILYRLSNQVVADVFAEYQFASFNSICVGPLGSAGCDKFGSKIMVGTQLKY